MKALDAGKHVLLEKPSADTAAETREMFELAEKKGLVLLEAFHYRCARRGSLCCSQMRIGKSFRFHPAVQRAKAILDSGELGAIKSVEATLTVPRGILKDDDIRFDYSLGGGGLMDMGCKYNAFKIPTLQFVTNLLGYTINCLRYLTSSNPTSVLSATPDLVPSKTDSPSLVDAGTTATLAFPSDITGTLTCHLCKPPTLRVIPKLPNVTFQVTCENGEMSMYNFVMPTLYHWIEVSVKTGKGGKDRKKRVEKVYKPTDPEWKGEEWWTTCVIYPSHSSSIHR